MDSREAEEEICGKGIAYVYCETNDGTVYEVMPTLPYEPPFANCDGELIPCKRYCITLGSDGEVIPPGEKFSELLYTEVKILHYESVSALKELLESNRNDFMEALIDRSCFVFTEEAYKIIRSVKPDEDKVSRLYKSLKTIERRTEWFDASRLFGYSDVDGDSATLVTALLKNSVKGKFSEEVTTLIGNIFKGFPIPSEDQKKKRVLKLIGFFVELADLL